MSQVKATCFFWNWHKTPIRVLVESSPFNRQSLSDFPLNDVLQSNTTLSYPPGECGRHRGVVCTKSVLGRRRVLVGELSCCESSVQKTCKLAASGFLASAWIFSESWVLPQHLTSWTILQRWTLCPTEYPAMHRIESLCCGPSWIPAPGLSAQLSESPVRSD